LRLTRPRKQTDHQLDELEFWITLFRGCVEEKEEEDCSWFIYYMYEEKSCWEKGSIEGRGLYPQAEVGCVLEKAAKTSKPNGAILEEIIGGRERRGTHAMPPVSRLFRILEDRENGPHHVVYTIFRNCGFDI
jgi:hypothetical protein